MNKKLRKLITNIKVPFFISSFDALILVVLAVLGIGWLLWWMFL